MFEDKDWKTQEGSGYPSWNPRDVGTGGVTDRTQVIRVKTESTLQ